MIANFIHGGAAISVMAKEISADLKVINLGVVGELDKDIKHSPIYVDNVISKSTQDFCTTNALTAY
jgi:nicotinate-nucleotide--dimethylbenzimidazole phosphoribosyltransferase